MIQSIEKIISRAHNALCSKGRTPMNGPSKFYLLKLLKMIENSSAFASTIASNQRLHRENPWPYYIEVWELIPKQMATIPRQMGDNSNAPYANSSFLVITWFLS